MSEALRFEILGPQRAWYADRPLDLGPGKQRAVLAVLLLAAGRPVPTGQIVDAVWPEEPPANGPNVVQKYVAGLRRVLEPDRSPRTPGQVLTLTDAGYLLRILPEAVDAVRFEREVQRARQWHAAGRTEDALAEVTTALERWQGEPFTGFAGPYFDAARHRLVELRAVALETRIELELAGGRHGELVGRLVELVAEFPVRERLRHQLMLALHRSGRQAEALAAYRDFADLLREEYGIEPGEALQNLHHRILRSDPTLLPTPRPATDPPAESPAGPPTAAAAIGGASRPPSASPVVAEQPPSASPVVAEQPPSVPPVVAEQRTPAAPAAWPPLVPAALAAPAPGTPPWAPPANPSVPSRPTPTWLGVVATIVSALAVLASFGMLTWLVVLCYAIWRRSWPNALAAFYYLGLGVTFVLVLGEGDPDEVTDAEGFLILAWLVSWLVGLLHAILLNGWLLRWLTRRWAGRRPVDERRLRREQARYLLHHYPAARHELRIGRPDLARTFDDGGLVDVNAVAEQVIAGLPGVTAAQGRQVVTERWVRGPFGSMEDLGARCQLPAALTDSLRDVLVFLPPPDPEDVGRAGRLVEMPDGSGSDGRPGTRRGGAAAAGG
ncbi:BTAD domain-containing putative transcriptional regulator [Micromonospora sp. NPDC005299]|uniref:BTAD domain-containing putative transcriptional regulator n=1 Tax=Micromonospora sp. NPDC005299 TaxID=3364231 RepID=UPI0036805595